MSDDSRWWDRPERKPLTAEELDKAFDRAEEAFERWREQRRALVEWWRKRQDDNDDT